LPTDGQQFPAEVGGKPLTGGTTVLPLDTAKIRMNKDTRSVVADGVKVAGDRECAGDTVLASAHADGDDSIGRE